MRLRPRLVDWSVFAAVAVAAATGLLTAFAGRPGDGWVFAVHGVAGLSLVVLLAWKLRRVAGRLRPSAWERSTAVSALALVAASATLATGVFWTLGGDFRLLAWNALTVHAFLGILLVPVVLIHLAGRFRLPRRADLEGRRTALQYAALIGGGALAWRAGQALGSAATVADRRFTGSREHGREAGNTFPDTRWVADDPAPIDPGEWRLRVVGAVGREVALDYGDLPGGDRTRATLDCTSGWYTTQRWGGVRVGRLLDAAGPADDARWVSFRSVTGYRWSLPIDEAREALLATRVGGERLSHGHGFPARLVAPGRRGFQWVKWVESVEVRSDPDYGQWVAIFASGFAGG